jgi:excisionase family DNA binding protein
MGDVTVTAGEAARRLGVAPATVQRWVDDGTGQAERTPGGHRRIYLTEVRRLIASARSVDPSGPVADWLDVLLGGDPARIQAHLVAARQRAGGWAEAADEVAAAVAEIGRRWEAGSCQVFEEHLASEALRRASAMCAAGLTIRADAPAAALFSVEGERHTLGLSLAELVFAEAGWRTFFIGEGLPADEVVPLVASLDPDLLVVSATTVNSPSDLARKQAELMRGARRAGVKLLLAGGGLWMPARNVKRAVSFQELSAIVAPLGRRRRKQAPQPRIRPSFKAGAPAGT